MRRDKNGRRTAAGFLGCFTFVVAGFLAAVAFFSAKAPEPCRLCDAAVAGDAGEVEAIAPGASPDDRNFALLLALRAEAPKPEVVRALLDSGADPNGKSEFKAEGRTTRHSLELAVTTYKPEIVSLMIARGADAKGDAGGFALRRAVESGNAEMLRILLDAGAPPGFSFKGEDAEALAVRSGREEMARILRERRTGG